MMGEVISSRCGDAMEDPCHLLDAPRVTTFVNDYINTIDTIEAVVEKLMGRSAFIENRCGADYDSCGRGHVPLYAQPGRELRVHGERVRIGSGYKGTVG
jgi:hypothetical protein